MQSEALGDNAKFALIFSGFKDPSPQTLRKVKTALVAELQIEAEIAKHIVERFPAVVISARNQQMLDPALQILENAGALVQIIDDPGALQALGARANSTPRTRPSPEPNPLTPEEQLEDLLFSLDQACLLPSSAEILEEIRPSVRAHGTLALANLGAALNQPLPFDVWAHVLLTAVAVICAGLIGYYF